MAPKPLIKILNGLSEPETRAGSIRDLARLLSSENVVIFCRDPEVDTLLPALGFPQTFSDCGKWRALLADCSSNGMARAALRDPAGGKQTIGYGYRAVNGSVLVLLASQEPDRYSVEQILALLPLLSTAFIHERKALGLRVSESHLIENLGRTKSLAIELDLARRSLQAAFHQAQTAKQRSSFLSEASRRLSTSLNLNSILDESAKILIPRLAHETRFYLKEDEGFRCKATHSDIGLEIGPVTDRLLEEVIATEKPARHTGSGLDLLVMPVTFLKKVGGVLSLARHTGSNAQFTPDEIITLHEYVDRFALSVENALLYQKAELAIRAREEFLTIASHELKTPLTTVLLSHQLIRKFLTPGSHLGLDGDTVLRLSDVVEERLLSLRKLVDTLMDVSRLPSGRLKLESTEVDLAALVNKVVEGFREQARHAESSISVNIVSVRAVCDPIRIEQALTNLIVNAIKYGSPGLIEVKVEPRDQYASIRVRDHGIGICPKDQKRIFDRFERAVDFKHITGLGLGLYVTKQIVESHDGAVHVESEPGKGSVFEIRLPAVTGSCATLREKSL